MSGCVLKSFAAAAAALLTVSPAFAQVTAQSARVEAGQRARTDVALRDNARASMSHEAETTAPSSPGDPDLGEQVILKRREKVRPFTVSADVSGFYTTNAALTDAFKVDDFFHGRSEPR